MNSQTTQRRLSAASRQRGRRSAFTLIELLVVVTIIGMLTGMTMCFIASGYRAADRLASLKLGNLSSGVTSVQPIPEAAALPATALPSQIDDQYAVVYQPWATNTNQTTEELAELVSGVVVYKYKRGFSVKTSATGVIELLKSHPSVMEVENEKLYYPCGFLINNSLKRIRAHKSTMLRDFPTVFTGTGIFIGGLPQFPDVRNMSQAEIRSGTDVTVAILDTGIDISDKELNVVQSMGFGFPNGEPARSPTTGAIIDIHGTVVARLIAANISKNNKKIIGVCPGARIWNMKIAQSPGSINVETQPALTAANTSTILAALSHVRANADKIHVAILNVSGAKSAVVDAAVNSTVAAGVVVVVPAGNGNTTIAGNRSPADASEAITVAAFADSDGKGPQIIKGPNTDIQNVADETWWGPSNRGPEVDFVAPGVDIVHRLSGIPKDPTNYCTGTSFSAALVAGVACLIRNGDAGKNHGIRNIRAFNNNQAFTPSEVLRLMQLFSYPTFGNDFIVDPLGRPVPVIRAENF